MTVEHPLALVLEDLPARPGAARVALTSAGQALVLAPQSQAFSHVYLVVASPDLAGRDPQHGQQEEQGCGGQLHCWGESAAGGGGGGRVCVGVFTKRKNEKICILWQRSLVWLASTTQHGQQEEEGCSGQLHGWGGGGGGGGEESV